MQVQTGIQEGSDRQDQRGVEHEDTKLEKHGNNVFPSKRNHEVNLPCEEPAQVRKLSNYRGTFEGH